MLAPMTLAEILNSTSAPAGQSAERAVEKVVDKTGAAALTIPKGSVAVPGTDLYVSEYWLKIPNVQWGLTAAATLVLILLTGFLLARMFRTLLEKRQLVGPLRWATMAIAVYMALIALHPKLMIDAGDLVTLIVHKIFVGVMCVVAVRLLDRLAIVPLMTRGGKVAVSRFVHQIVIIVISLFMMMGYASWAFHIDVTSLLAGSAVISIVLGLALQETLGNFFSGMVMQASSPFQIGDWIEVGGVEGRVVDMTWRTVTLHTLQDNYVLIPNGVVAKEHIVNYHAPSRATARSIQVGLEYSVAPNDARRVLKAAATDSDGVLKEPEPVVVLADYADSAIVYKVVFWIDNPARHGAVENAVRVNAWYRLKQAGFNIPFPMRTVESVDLHQKLQAEREASRAARCAAIRKIPLFAQLRDEQVGKLAADAHELTLAAGQLIFRQHDAGDSLFVLVAGSATTCVTAADGREIEVGILEAGNHFGEFSALTGQPRPISVRARSDVAAIEITRDHLKELFASDPDLMQHMSAIVAQRQAERDQRLQSLGATTPTDQPPLHPHTVLNKMKGLFSVLQPKPR